MGLGSRMTLPSWKRQEVFLLWIDSCTTYTSHTIQPCILMQNCMQRYFFPLFFYLVSGFGFTFSYYETFYARADRTDKRHNVGGKFFLNILMCGWYCWILCSTATQDLLMFLTLSMPPMRHWISLIFGMSAGMWELSCQNDSALWSIILNNCKLTNEDVVKLCGMIELVCLQFLSWHRETKRDGTKRMQKLFGWALECSNILSDANGRELFAMFQVIHP